MYFTVEEFAKRMREQLAHGAISDFWSEVWHVIESQTTRATGENYCFEIRAFDELLAAPSKLYALPAASAGRWDSIAFAQSALEGMRGNETLEDFIAIHKAARLEIVKSRLFCVAHHVFWAATTSDDATYGQSVDEWLSEIGGERLGYADEECYKPLCEPHGCIPQGRARWLFNWLQFRYDNWASPVTVSPIGSDEEDNRPLPPYQVDRSIVLSAAAFTWHDYAQIEEAETAELMAAAGHSLVLASQSADDDSGPASALSGWGREGGLSRHRHTRALKDWALGEAGRMQGSDRHIARTLADRLPEKFVDASEDPVRLIYDAIRSKRAEVRGRSSTT